MTGPEARAAEMIQAYNDKDFAKLESIYAPNIDMAHFNRNASFSSSAELIAVIKAFAADFAPDRKFLPPERVTVSGNTVVRESYWTGTAVQDIPDFAAKGEAFRFRLCSVMVFDDAGMLIEWKDHG